MERLHIICPTRLRPLAACVTLLVAAGCAGKTMLFSSLPEVPRGRSSIVVYRLKRMRANDVHPYVYLNGEKQFALRSAGYNVLTVDPGQYKVEAKGSTLAWGMATKAVTVDLGPDQTCFLRLYVEPGVFQDTVVFEKSDEETSLAALRSLRLSN